MKNLSIKYLFRNKKNKNTFLLLFLLYALICIFLSIYFFYDYKLNKLDNSMTIEAIVENKEVLNNKVLEKKECKKYSNYYCIIPLNIYNKDEIVNYLNSNNVSYNINIGEEKKEEFINVKYVLLVILIILTLFSFILSINITKKKLEREKKTKYILRSLGCTKKKLILFDYIYLIPIISIFFIISEFALFFITSLGGNLEFYRLYVFNLSTLYFLVLITYLLTYLLYLLKNNRGLTK